MNPEIKVWTAVLIHAARELLPAATDGRQIFRAVRRRSAWEWFESDRYDVGAFLWCADTIGIDGPSFRRRLFRLADHKNGYISDRSQAKIVDPGASSREVFRHFTSENEKVSL